VKDMRMWGWCGKLEKKCLGEMIDAIKTDASL
jgi:hypothetical protein